MIDLFSLPELRLGLEETRGTMERALEGASPCIRDGLSSLLSRNGKMVRAALVILASGFGKADAGRMLGIAAAVELLHMATLIHDDVIDAAPKRRGKPTLSAVHGSRQAVLIGDYVLTRSLKLLVDSVPNGDPVLFSRTVGRICEGEIEQGFQRYDVGVTPRAYLRRIHGKTASLFGAGMRLAALEASCPRGVAQALTRFGYCLGMGFQIMDDILDFTGNEKELGKPCGSDAADGVFTLPLIFAIREKGVVLASLLKKPPYSRFKIKKILNAVRSSGGLGHAREVVGEYYRLGSLELDRLPDIKARSALGELADIVLDRKA